MRLIDADAIIYDEREPDVLAITEYDIESMPTIDAIPVSFINDMIVLYEKIDLPYGASVLECLIDDWHDELKCGRGFTQDEKEIIGQ